jgi:outer membrane protein assembly factor BamB
MVGPFGVPLNSALGYRSPSRALTSSPVIPTLLHESTPFITNSNLFQLHFRWERYTSIEIRQNHKGYIYALQSTNGSLLWHDQLNATPYSALLANGNIYLSTTIGSYAGAAYAVRMSDGSLLWNYPISGSMYNAPVLDGTTLYVGATNGMAYALQADNGTLLWHYLTQVQP